MNEINFMSASQLRDELKNRQISVEELVKFYLDRIDIYDKNNGLNTVSEIDETVIKQARAMDMIKSRTNLPLFGVPILVKDNIDVLGLHTTAGSLALSDNICKKDAPIIQNLKHKGAIILGKTNMTEFANFITEDMPNGYSSRGGQVINAFDRNKDSGGSSTGSAVAVSAGFCAAAIGTDTSFSIVGCAAENGVTGLKPPAGALSSTGIIPISHTIDSAGALAKDFTDAYMIYSGMCQEDLEPILPMDPKKLHIAVNISNRDEVSNEQLERYDILFRKLKDAGVTFSEISQPSSEYAGDIMFNEFKHDLEEYLYTSNAKNKYLSEIINFYENNPETMKHGITILKEALIETSGKLDEVHYLEALSKRKILIPQIKNQLKNYDICIMTGLTNIMHFAGLPSIALRMCITDNNIPKGIIAYGADERRLYSAALTIEKYCDEIIYPKL